MAGEESTGPGGAGASPARQARAARSTAAAGAAGDDAVAVAREICLSQLAARPRSRAELATVLRRRGVADDVAEQVLDRLVEVGLIDDEAFAAAFVSSARAGRGLGRRALATELRRRGVAPEASETALAAVGAEDEEETARALVARRLRAMDGLPAPVRVRRLIALLARKGYDLELARRVVTAAVPDADDDADGDAHSLDQHRSV
ncbi:recombination regulator RecX [Parafrankia discariae]|uniref:recombination regulator RecX n=1 Tax=Parafrankia discariae TaxID=365528 RepID=UPI000360BA9D